MRGDERLTTPLALIPREMCVGSGPEASTASTPPPSRKRKVIGVVVPWGCTKWTSSDEQGGPDRLGCHLLQEYKCPYNPCPMNIPHPNRLDCHLGLQICATEKEKLSKVRRTSLQVLPVSSVKHKQSVSAEGTSSKEADAGVETHGKLWGVCNGVISWDGVIGIIFNAIHNLRTRYPSISLGCRNF